MKARVRASCQTYRKTSRHFLSFVETGRNAHSKNDLDSVDILNRDTVPI